MIVYTIFGIIYSMEDVFKIWRFRYKNKITLPLDVFAREEKTAQEVVSWWNKDLPIEQQWYKPRFNFKHKAYSLIPPYELEQEQIKTAIELYERRKKNEREKK